MKLLYLTCLGWLLFAIFLSSCSPHFRAEGLKDKESSYVITSSGKRIDAHVIKNNFNYAIVDSTKYLYSDVAAIKNKKEYTFYQNGTPLYCLIYGKINLLGQLTTSYSYTPAQPGMPGSMSHYSNKPSMNYYLQRQNTSEIDYLTDKNLIDYTADNSTAVRKAKAARIWHIVTYTTAATSIVGLTSAIFLTSSGKGTIAGTIGLVSLPVFLVSIPIGNHKTKSAIRVYNRE